MTARQPEDDPEVPETGAVFTFGRCKYGEAAPSKFWIKKDEVGSVLNIRS
jgi:X-linked retinitis pigmentosa GTPase regulator